MNYIKQFINKKETEVFKFCPNQKFYKKTGINRKRWGQIFRGEKEPTVSELLRMADYFDVSITEFLNNQES